MRRCGEFPFQLQNLDWSITCCRKTLPSINKFYSPTLMEFSDNKCAVCCSELNFVMQLKLTVDTEFVETGKGADLIYLPGCLHLWNLVIINAQFAVRNLTSRFNSNWLWIQNLRRRGGGDFDLLALPAFLLSVISSFFYRKKGGEGAGPPGPSPRPAYCKLITKASFQISSLY